MSELYEAAYKNIVLGALKGNLTFFLGAGANLCGRPEGMGFVKGENLPSGEELARALSDRFTYPPDRPDKSDLIRVAQWASVSGGESDLADFLLSEVFKTPCPPTPLHDWLAAISARIRRLEPDTRRYPLIITANYDDSLELALDNVGEAYDLIAYHRGRLLHWLCEPDSPRGTPVQIETRTNPSMSVVTAEKYLDVDPDKRTVVLKVHGLVDRSNRANVSFVITEDHYIDYLTQLTPDRLLPPHILRRLAASNFLFLGYSLRDWNVRAILKQIWDARDASGESGKNWAVLKEIADDDKLMWAMKKVEILEQPLDEFVLRVQGVLDSVPATGAVRETA